MEGNQNHTGYNIYWSTWFTVEYNERLKNQNIT